MRRFALAEATGASELERALAEGPLELLLERAPRAIARLDLVQAVGRAAGPLVARFDHDLATPLAEVALLCAFGRFPERVALHLADALLSPLLVRHGARGALRLLARHGARIPAAEALGAPVSDLSGRSPLALRLAAELLKPPHRGVLPRELASFGLVMSGSDREEGIRAFRARRPPLFDWGR